MGRAAEIARAVRSGETSALAVAEEALATIGRTDGALSAFLLVDAEGARRAAELVDEAVEQGEDPGPLAGVPVAVKDNLCVEGLATTCGSRLLEGWVAPYDATVVARLRRAGAVVVGKTNMDEFAMGSSTEHSAFGPTRNPLDLNRVPGGSSGGSAAAVASGMVPLALGSDTGGSIRQPAAFCGAVGLKPTYGAVSRYGLVAFASSLDQVGPITLDVADAALALSVIGGHDERDSTSLAEGPSGLDDWQPAPVAGLAIGVVEELVEGADSGVRDALLGALDALRSAGATVESVSLPEVRWALSAYYLLAPAEASSNLARFDGIRYGLRVEGADVEATNVASRTAGFGPEVRRRIMLGTYALSAGYYDAYYGKAERARTLLQRAFAERFGRFDVLLGATAPTVAFRLGEKTADPWSMYLSDVDTVSANLAGLPAVSVPFANAEDGLPAGVQVIGPPRGESVVLSVAAELERRSPRPADAAERGEVAR
jgi:aspartyl-tRNA(Asn)/glutamyl-tRNA(Gln) amidotransferase subunit A